MTTETAGAIICTALGICSLCAFAGIGLATVVVGCICDYRNQRDTSEGFFKQNVRIQGGEIKEFDLKQEFDSHSLVQFKTGIN